MIKPAFYVSAALLLGGCVVAPVTRTWFAPELADGTPRRLSACGYHRAADDGLGRALAGLEVEVFPLFVPGAPLRLLLRSGQTRGTVALDPRQIRLQLGGAVAPQSPESVSLDNPGPYFSTLATAVFTQRSADAMEISVLLGRGFLTVDGKASPEARFRFHKTTTSDVFFASLNC